MADESTRTSARSHWLGVLCEFLATRIKFLSSFQRIPHSYFSTFSNSRLISLKRRICSETFLGAGFWDLPIFAIAHPFFELRQRLACSPDADLAAPRRVAAMPRFARASAAGTVARISSGSGSSALTAEHYRSVNQIGDGWLRGPIALEAPPRAPSGRANGRVVQTDAALVLIVAGETHAIVNIPVLPGNLTAAIARALSVRPVRAF